MTRKDDDYGRTRRNALAGEYADSSVDDAAPWPGQRSSTRALGAISRRADGGDVSAEADDRLLAAAASPGVGLPGSLRARLEASLASDLSAVRVHTGPASAEAARSVGAVAYATGQDIHFGDGAYQPGSAQGDALIAHEVAHTVQQRGATADLRQDKLEVSSPADAHEVEAEAFAQSFVAGHDASVTQVTAGSVSRAVISRKDDKKDDKDKQWAKDARPKVQSVMDATLAAAGVLNKDAQKACDALDEVQKIFTEYEKEYNEAAERFETAIKKAKEKDKEIKENIKLGFEVALVAGGAMGGVAGEMAEVGESVAKVNTVGEAAGKLVNAKLEAPEHKVPPSADVDWKGALSAAITSYRAYVGQNQMILAIQNACNDALKTIATAEDPDSKVKNVKESEAGINAQKVADGAKDAVAKLQSIKDGMLSRVPLKFQSAAAGLKGKESKDLEKDIAIKWIAEVVKPPPVGKTVAATDNEDISSALAYLKKIGVVGAGSSLGVDTGGWMSTFWEVQLVEMRARVEQEAKELVGKFVQKAGDHEVASPGGSFNARFVGVSPADNMVRVVSYTISPLTDGETSNWKNNWSDNGARMKAEAMCRAHVTVEAHGQLAPENQLDANGNPTGGTVNAGTGVSGTTNAAE